MLTQYIKFFVLTALVLPTSLESPPKDGITPIPCDSRPVPGNAYEFEQKSNGQWIKTGCPPGMTYDPVACSCNMASGQVNVTADACTDTHKKCSEWKNVGFCKGEHAELMEKKCKRSCNINNCTAIATEAPKTAPSTTTPAATIITAPTGNVVSSLDASSIDLPYTDRGVELTTTRQFEDGVTKQLSLSCKHTQQTSDIQSLGYLTLFKDDFGDNYLAYLDNDYPNDVAVQNSMGAKVSGSLVTKGDSVLTYEWSYPSNETAGDYTCRAVGVVLDESRRLLNSYATVAVSEISNDVDSLLKHVKTMAGKLVEAGGDKLEEQERKIKEQTSIIEMFNATLDEKESILETCNANATDMTAKLDEQENINEVCKATTTTQAAKLDEQESRIKVLADQSRIIDELNKRMQYLMIQPTLDFKGFDKQFSYKGHEYLLSKTMKQHTPKFQTICGTHGGYLVEINDKGEYNAILDNVKLTNAIAIGAKRENGKAPWRFMASGGDVNYFNWDSSLGYPTSADGHNCMFLSRRSSNKLMFNHPCVASYWTVRILCEVH